MMKVMIKANQAKKSKRKLANKTMKSGFTMLEIVVALVFAGIFVVLFFIQKNNLDAMQRDEKRKVAINAIYYALEEGYFKDKNAYPEQIKNPETLPWIDPNLFTDPRGINLWDGIGDYKYETANCKDGECKEYTLSAKMEKEAQYIKTNRR